MQKGLLVGAGFSYDFGMPLGKELTEVFLGLFNKRNVRSLAVVLSKNSPYSEDRPINKEAILEGLGLLLEYKKRNESNYEELFSELQKLGDSSSKNQSDKDSYHYLFSIFYDIVHSILSIYQDESYSVLYARNKQWHSKLSSLLSDKETWIFTLNHDLYMECLAVDLNIPITYGDIKNISFPVSNQKMNDVINFTYSEGANLDKDTLGFHKNEYGINLIKLHGGLSELDYKDKSIICNQSLKKNNSSELIHDFRRIENMAYFHHGKKIPSGKSRVITNSEGQLDIISKSMLTGGKKYSKTTNTKKGEEKLKIFDDVLDEIDELTIIGYGFGDPHINNRISNAMVRNKNLKLRIVNPTSVSNPKFLEQFDYNLRLQGALCRVAEWMEYSDTEKWDSDQINALKENEKYRLDIKKRVETVLRSIYGQEGIQKKKSKYFSLQWLLVIFFILIGVLLYFYFL